jgi:hypothetical protein
MKIVFDRNLVKDVKNTGGHQNAISWQSLPESVKSPRLREAWPSSWMLGTFTSLSFFFNFSKFA